MVVARATLASSRRTDAAAAIEAARPPNTEGMRNAQQRLATAAAATARTRGQRVNFTLCMDFGAFGKRGSSTRVFVFFGCRALGFPCSRVCVNFCVCNTLFLPEATTVAARSCLAPLDVWRWRKVGEPCRFLPPSRCRANSSTCIRDHGKQRLGLRPVELPPTTIKSMGRVRFGGEPERLLQLAGLMSSASAACRQHLTRRCNRRRVRACPV